MSDEQTPLSKVEPDLEATQDSSPNSTKKFNPTLLIVLIVAQLVFSLYIYRDKENQIKSLREDISKVESDLLNTLYELKNPDIDMTVKMYQPFSDGFGILIQEIEVLPNGKKIQGRIVNFDSVTVFEIDLTFVIGADSKDFMVGEIKAGGSRKFTVTVEGQDALTKNIAKVIWNGNKFY